VAATRRLPFGARQPARGRAQAEGPAPYIRRAERLAVVPPVVRVLGLLPVPVGQPGRKCVQLALLAVREDLLVPALDLLELERTPDLKREPGCVLLADVLRVRHGRRKPTSPERIALRRTGPSSTLSLGWASIHLLRCYAATCPRARRLPAAFGGSSRGREGFMPASTSTPDPVVHEPTLPTEADLERLSELYGHATTYLQGVNFRLRAYTRPFFEEGDDPATERPSFADIGVTYQLVEYLKLDRWALDEEIKTLSERLRNLITLRDEG